METETLRPELQSLLPNADTPRNELLDAPTSQLKQEPTVNHHSLQPNIHAPIPNHHSRTATQLPSPGSDDPTTHMGDITESLQDPKPSSASTDPTPQMQTPQQKLKQLPCVPTPVASPCASPQVAVKKLPTVDANKLSTCSTTLHPLPPFSFPHEDGFSSDEDDDFCRFYYSMLRRKSDAEMAAPVPTSPVVVEQPKKPRSTRQSNNKVQRRRTKEALREIPFSDPKYHKVVGAMALRPADIARDLATIYGREYKESLVAVGNNKPPARPNKRQRGCDTPTGGSPSQAKRLRQTNASNSDGGDKNTVAEVGRSTRYAKRSSGYVTSSSERGHQGSNKRQKMNGCSAGNTENEQKKMFEKHPDKKGWVVCKKCEAAVWPPNCGKHLFHCRKL